MSIPALEPLVDVWTIFFLTLPSSVFCRPAKELLKDLKGREGGVGVGGRISFWLLKDLSGPDPPIIFPSPIFFAENLT